MKQYSDKELVRLLNKHDRSAMDALYAKLFEGTLKAVGSFLKDSNEAEDITMEALFKLWDSKTKFKNIDN